MKIYIYSLLLRIYLFFAFLWRKAASFVCGSNEQGDTMQSGELDVVGKDKVEIVLGDRHPDSVIVKFKGHHHHVPCNPHHHDELRWEIKNKHHHHPHDSRHDHCHHEDTYVLVISWHVTDVRTIEWLVYY